jgi:hypothetical protein
LPALPTYIHRLAQASAALQDLPTEWVDRRALEEALGVSKWTAWRILKQCGAEDGPGGALICRRDALIRQLQDLQEHGSYKTEIERRERLEQYLDSIVRFASRKHKQIVRGNAASIALLSARFRSLPPGVELTPTELKIAFRGTEDFLQKVGALVYALQNDLEAVSEFLDTPTRSDLIRENTGPGNPGFRPPR